MKKYVPLLAAVAAVSLLCGCSQTDTQSNTATPQTPTEAVQTADTGALERIIDMETTQYFTDAPVSEQDVETILAAGVNAPSAMNGQPWHFSVITDKTVLEQINQDMSGGMNFGGTLPDGMTAPDNLPEGMQMPDGAGMTPPGGTEGTQPPEGFTLPEGFTPTEGSIPSGSFTPPEGTSDGTPPSGFPGGTGSGFGGGSTKAGITDAPLAIVISCTDGSELDAGLACQNMSAAAQLLGYGTKIVSAPTMALNGAKQAEYRELLGIPENQSAAAILLIGEADTSVDTTADTYTGATTRNPLSDMVTYVNAQ